MAQGIWHVNDDCVIVHTEKQAKGIGKKASDVYCAKSSRGLLAVVLGNKEVRSVRISPVTRGTRDFRMLSQADFDAIAKSKTLETLVLPGFVLNASHIKQICSNKSIRSLRFIGTWFESDVGPFMNQLASMKKLEKLELFECQFENDETSHKEKYKYPKLTYLKMENTRVSTVNQIVVASNMPSLETLLLRRHGRRDIKTTAEHVRTLNKLKRLKTLGVQVHSHDSELALAEVFAGMPDLVHLELFLPGINPDEDSMEKVNLFSKFNKKIQLQVLRISSTNAISVASLGNQTNLKELGYYYHGRGSYTSDELAFLANCPKFVKFVGMGLTWPSNEKENALTKLRALKHLSLSSYYGKITWISKLESLENLTIQFEGCSDEELAQTLSQLPQLNKLNCGMNFGPKALEQLSTMPNLKELKLSGSRERLGWQAVFPVEILQTMPMLEGVTLRCFTKIDAKWLSGLQKVKNLRKLVLTIDEIVPPESYEAIGMLSNLREFCIQGSFVVIKSWNKNEPDPVLVTIEPLTKLTKLESLSIGYLDLTDDDLVKIGQMKSLKSLCVNADKATRAGLSKLYGLKNLRRLRIRVPGYSEGAVSKLLEIVPCQVSTQ